MSASPEDGPLASARHAVLQIGGMTCSNCSFAVERALNSLDFVEKCQVDLINGKAFVHYSGGTAADLCEEVEAIGFDARVLEDEAALSGAHVVLHLLVEGKGRDAGIASLESTPGVLECRADVDELCVTFDPLHAGARDLVAVLKKHGLQVKTDHAGGKLAAEAVPRGLPTAVLLTMGIILVSDVLPCIEHCEHVLYKHLVPGLPCITVLLGALATPVQLFCGFRFHLGAYHAVMSGVWDMNVLISLGTALCFLYSLMVMLFMIVAFHIGGSTMDCKAPPPSYFETPCFVITTILVGKYLEAWARSGASQALRQLLALKPQTAHLLRGVEVEEVPAQLLQLGDTLQVFPGETVPTDGVLTSASADFDESLLTGESRPVRKAAGDVVIGGSKCVTGRVEMRVEKLGSQTMLSQIMALVEEAQLSRAPVQHIADQIARHFVPGIVALSVVTWGVWFLLVYTWQVVPLASILRGRTSNWPELDKAFFVLEHGLNVLLVACPCALGLATPTAVMAATGAAASCGILVRSGAKPLELGSQVQKVVLDKTGTLTTGKPSAVAAALVCPWAMEESWGELLQAFRDHRAASKVARKVAFASDLPTDWLSQEAIRWPTASCEDSSPSPSESTKDSESRLRLTLPGSEAAKAREQLRTEAERALWWALGSAEISSEHSLAKELVELAGQKARVSLSKPESFENLTGVGLRCMLGDLSVEVTAAKHILSSQHALLGWTEAQMSAGATVVAVAVGGTTLAAVALRDALAPRARACVAQLELAGMEVWMCTGDHQMAAEAVASEVGIAKDRVVAEALPADKVRLVKSLQKDPGAKTSQSPKSIVAMVGDGVNDAPALAAADLSVAIGAGQQVTVDAADIVLVRSDLRDLLAFFALSKKTLQTIWFNFMWAFMFNICALPLAAGAFWQYGVLINPQIACLLMLGSSLFVVLSSLMLKRFTPPELPGPARMV